MLPVAWKIPPRQLREGTMHMVEELCTGSTFRSVSIEGCVGCLSLLVPGMLESYLGADSDTSKVNLSQRVLLLRRFNAEALPKHVHDLDFFSGVVSLMRSSIF